MLQNKIINYIIIVLLVIGSFFIIKYSFLGKIIIKSLGGYTIQNVTTTIDTLDIKVDTTLIIDRWLTINANLLKPTIFKDTTIVIKKDTTIVNMDTTIVNYPSISIKDLYKFVNPISDTLIDGNITTIIDFNSDKLLSQNLVYKPKFPIIIERTIPIVKEVTREYSNNRNIGIGADINSLGEYSILGAYQTNKGWQFQSGYTFNRDVINTPDKIRIGIIKFF